MSQLFFGPDGSPLSQPEDVIIFLGKQEHHWREDRSAYQTAHRWFAAKGLPTSIREILHADAAFAGAKLQKAVFENKTKLDDYGRASQTDVLAILNLAVGHAVLGIEAKANESFGRFVFEWNDYSPGKLRRMAGLLERLQLTSGMVGKLRYQLIHRTAAMLIEAEKIGAREAAMLVQSFDQNRAGYDDFTAFADAFGTPVKKPGVLSRARTIGDVTIRLGWTENRMQFVEG